jgi:vancomycin aglycone glucosyltransferase
MAAVVHHGGAGTTAAASRAGVPQVIVPMFSDQFYWADRVDSLGIGTIAGDLVSDRLPSALHDALMPSVSERSRSLAPQLSMNGASIAARRLETLR